MSNKFAFMDGIENIVFVDGVLRMDMVTLSKGSEKQPSLRVTGHLCMSPSGFLRTHQQMGQVISGLVEQGVLKKNESKQPLVTSPEELPAVKSDKNAGKNVKK